MAVCEAHLRRLHVALGGDVYRSYRMPISGLDYFRVCFVNITILSFLAFDSHFEPRPQCMEKIAIAVSQTSPNGTDNLKTLASSTPIAHKAC